MEVIRLDAPTHDLTVQYAGSGLGSVLGGGIYTEGDVATLTAAPSLNNYLFVGWRIDGVYAGWANPLTVTMSTGHVIQATFSQVVSFSDSHPTPPDFNPITELATRGTIRGYATGTFGPGDGVQRAQMAALIARAMPAGPGTPPTMLQPPACVVSGSWDCEDWGNSFKDQSGAPGLWRDVGTLRHYNVAFGYGGDACEERGVSSPCFAPNEPVSYAQTISFITRAMIAKGYWVAQPNAPQPYPNVPSTRWRFPHLQLVYRRTRRYSFPHQPTGTQGRCVAGLRSRSGLRWIATGAPIPSCRMGARAVAIVRSCRNAAYRSALVAERRPILGHLSADLEGSGDAMLRKIAIALIVLVAVSGVPGAGLQSSRAAPGTFAASAMTAVAGIPKFFDLVVDDAHSHLFGSNKAAGTVVVLGHANLNTVKTIALGPESSPSGMSLSGDSAQLAVALYGAGQIALIDTSTLTVTGYLQPLVESGPNQPYDVRYGRAGRLYGVRNPQSFGTDYVHAFDTVTRTEVSDVGIGHTHIRSAPRLAITADHNTLYVSESGGLAAATLSLRYHHRHADQDRAGPHGPVLVWTFAINADASAVYTSAGQVWSGDLQQMSGEFAASGCTSST
ncbi:MAG: S-layer homology domain-containing protein [Thermomicrobiales bacterium]